MVVKACFQIILECICDHAEMWVRDNNSSVCLPFVSWRPSNISQGKPVKTYTDTHTHTHTHTHTQAGKQAMSSVVSHLFSTLLFYWCLLSVQQFSALFRGPAQCVRSLQYVNRMFNLVCWPSLCCCGRTGFEIFLCLTWCDVCKTGFLYLQCF